MLNLDHFLGNKQSRRGKIKCTFQNEKPKYQTKIKNLLYFTPVSCKLKINQEKEKPKHKPKKGKKLLSRLHLDL